MTIRIGNPCDEEPLEPDMRRLELRAFLLDQSPICGRCVVGPEDDRGTLTTGDGVQTVVVTGRLNRSEAYHVVVQLHIDVNRRTLDWNTERPGESESLVELSQSLDRC